MQSDEQLYRKQANFSFITYVFIRRYYEQVALSS